MNRKYPTIPFLNFLVMAFWFFQKFYYSQEFGTQNIGRGYYKFRLNKSERFYKIFGVGILENLLAAKIEGNYI